MRFLDFFKKEALLYKNCSEIPIKNFDIAKKTNDLRWISVGYTGYEDVKLPNDAEQRLKDLVTEWIELIDNSEIAYYYDLLSDVMYLETRYQVSKMLLHQMYIRQMKGKTLDMYVEMLKDWNYHYRDNDDYLAEIHRLVMQNKASQNKLGMKKDELKELQDKNGDAPDSLEKQAVTLEQITGKNNIDIEKVSVAKWVEITKIAHEINLQRQKKK